MATIRDVASRAQVSIATVSRVINGNARVGKETASRVWQAAEALDYWPNSAARSLTTNRTQVLGVLLPEIHGEFFSEVIRGIDQAAREARFQILVSSSHANGDELTLAARSMRGRIDGLIVMASDEATASAISQIAHAFPVLLLNPCREIAGCRSLMIANYEGARMAVSHLSRLGHRAIALLKGPAGNVDARERQRGYRQALREAGIEPEGALEIPGDFSERSGYGAAGRLLACRPCPTAVFAANDNMAVGLLSALTEARIEVPRQMAIVGFDNISMARYLTPPLTTVHVDMYELGRQAVRHLLAGHPPGAGTASATEVMPVALVVRQSCGSAWQRGAAPGRQGGREDPGSDGMTIQATKDPKR